MGTSVDVEDLAAAVVVEAHRPCRVGHVVLAVVVGTGAGHRESRVPIVPAVRASRRAHRPGPVGPPDRHASPAVWDTALLAEPLPARRRGALPDPRDGGNAPTPVRHRTRDRPPDGGQRAVHPRPPPQGGGRRRHDPRRQPHRTRSSSWASPVWRGPTSARTAILAATAPVALIAQLLSGPSPRPSGSGSCWLRRTLVVTVEAAPVPDRPVHGGGGPHRREARLGHRHRRRGHVGGDRGPADRLSARHLRSLQPAGGTGRHAREPGRRAGLGPGAPRPSPARRDHRHPPRALRRLGGVGRRRRREPHHLSDPPAVPLARAMALVARRPARRAGRRRHAPRPCSRDGPVPGPTVPADGVHPAPPDRHVAGVAGGPRPGPGRATSSSRSRSSPRPSPCWRAPASRRSGRPEEAWADFRGWRVNYESVAYRLCGPPDRTTGAVVRLRRHLATGVVEPRRPPQRRPGGGPVLLRASDRS